MAKKYMVMSEDGLIGTAEFREQAGNEGKVFGVQTGGTVGLIDKQDVMQYTETTMPTASETYKDKIVQYIGTTTTSYTNGYFYKCIHDEVSLAYTWSPISVQDLSDQYLALSGGTMTGPILSNMNPFVEDLPIIRGYSETSSVIIRGGNAGSTLKLNGNYSTGDGFNLTAKNTDGSAELAGYSNGTLKWNNYNVLTTNDIADDLSTESATEALSANMGKELADMKQDVMQFTTMPEASGLYRDRIVQFTGETGTYTTGTFYKCVVNSETGAFSWQEIGTSGCLPLSGGTMTGDINIGTHQIKDDDGSYFNFNEGIFTLHLKNGLLDGELVADANLGVLRWNSIKVLDINDISDNLTSSYSDSPLSAKQGKVLNDTKLSLSGGTMTGAITMGTNAVSLGGTNLTGSSGSLTWGGNDVCVKKSATLSTTYNTNWSSSSKGKSRAIKIADNMYYLQLSFSYSAGLTADTYYTVITAGNLKIDGNTPKYASLAGSSWDTISAVGCWLSNTGILYICPTKTLSSGATNINVTGIVYCE